MRRVLIIGSSGHFNVIAAIFELMSGFQIVGVIDDFKIPGDMLKRYPVLGAVNDIEDLYLRGVFDELFIAIGDNLVRSRVFEHVISVIPNIIFPNAVHPNSIISNSVIMGFGNCFMAGSIINPNTSIGNFSIFNTNSSIDHDNIVGSFTSIGPRACTGGHVCIEDYVFVGIGSTIKDRINIGNGAIVGAGSLILKDCCNNTLYYGHPAKAVRKLI